MYQRIKFLLMFIIVFVTASSAVESTPILSQMKKLEDRRDPKCYATAARLENFIYGTPLSSEARFTKNLLQKAWVAKLWEDASKLAERKHLKEIGVEEVMRVQNSIFTYRQLENKNWKLLFSNGQKIEIEAKDKRQYSSVAYALRSLMAVKQDLMFHSSKKFFPLSEEAVESIKNASDLYMLAVLKRTDHVCRMENRYTVEADDVKKAWNELALNEKQKDNKVKTKIAADNYKVKDLKILKEIIAQKLSSYAAYNNINNQLFVRNLQVYFAKLSWPKDKKEANIFRNTFTETMIYFAHELYIGSQKLAMKRGHQNIEEKDVYDFVQTFMPHKINEFEDAIFFPALGKKEQVVIESYDMDAFRDSGLHWTYLKYAVDAPEFKSYLEPDPFAMELIVENIAQFGVLALRVTGDYGKREGAKRLKTEYFKYALTLLQAKIQKNAKQRSKPDDKKESKLLSVVNNKSNRLTQNYFTDVTEKIGIQSMHRSSDWLNRLLRTYLKKDPNRGTITIPPAFGGSGVASDDVNNDGLHDILILSGRGNTLYLNRGGERFEDVTEVSGLAWVRPEDNRPGEPRQPLIADLDNDGHKDIIITYVDDLHRVYRNRGDGTFEDVSLKAMLGGKGEVVGPAVLVDIDNDGLLDIYVTYFGNYIRGVLPTLKRHNDNGGINQIFRNKGNFTFENVTKNSGLDDNGWAQAVTHTDFNQDGKQDIILGNDFGTNGYYLNQGDGTFINMVSEYGTDKASYTMSLGLDDLNGDFIPDIYISNIVTMNKDEKYVLPEANTTMKFNPDKLANMRVVEANDFFLSKQDSDGTLHYKQSHLVGRGYSTTGWSWDSDFFDYDNDGDDDLYVVNGMNEFNLYSSDNPYYADPHGNKMSKIYMPVSPKEKNVFFVNDAGLLNNHSEESALNILSNSRSVSYLDFDLDGDLDIILNNYHQRAYFFQNNADKLKNNWLKVELKGDPKLRVNLDAVGAALHFTTPSGNHIWRQVSSVTGYMSVHPKEQHIGLGTHTHVDLTVLWPNGKRSSYKDLPANKRIVIKYGEPEITFKK